MSTDYETLIEELDSYTDGNAGPVPDSDHYEAAVEAMTLVSNLHAALVENGAQLSEEPDADEIGTVLDNVFGELSAASLFLSEASFARVPDMLRKVASALETQNAEPWEDPQGDSTPAVPDVVIRGFRNFATRLDATKVQKQQAINALKKVGV